MSKETNGTNNKTFYLILSNNFIALFTNSFIWFAITFWVYIVTQSVLITSWIAGVYVVASSLSSFIFGRVVDANKKKKAMMISSVLSLGAYCSATLVYYIFALNSNANSNLPILWLFIILLLMGSVAGNLRSIALSTVVSILFPSEGRDKANGLVGVVNGISFSATSFASGLVIGFLGMDKALWIAIGCTIIAIIQLSFIEFREDIIKKTVLETEEIVPKKSILALVLSVPGLAALILFTTFNNFLGGVFMALMDAYGLSLVSVQTWGLLWGFLSFGFIIGGVLITRFGLSQKPLRLLMLINLVTWTVCIFFTIQKSIVLTAIGLLIWMILIPFVEAIEQTIIQKVVPIEKQGSVFGFAQSVESAASPLTTFLIGPIAQFVFIPYMTTGGGVNLIGGWFGVGSDRGIALVFVIAGIIGVIVTLLAFASRQYRIISQSYAETK